MTKDSNPPKVQRIHTPAELGGYLREHRREQAVTISDASNLVSPGERFISEVERGKQTAFFNKTLQYINQLGLSLHIYPKNILRIQAPYGAISDLKTIGTLARHHRKSQRATLKTARELSGLSLRFLSDFERGKNSQTGKALVALNTYGLEIAISPRNYRLNRADLLNA